jgi:hypothetical protein
MTDFTKALEEAQKLPELPDELENNLPDILKGNSELPNVVTRVESSTQGEIPGSTKWDFDYNCARLIIGQQLTGLVNNQPIYEDHDDSDRLKEIMDLHLAAKAIIFKKEETFLKDGTVIVWLEWGLPKPPMPKEERDFLTQAELMSPELSDKKSDNSEDDID